ncbi:MAG: hypothetical protein GY718_18255, partial [Lentisphaerae bacterium]|nr:hypothetical protein [Lentisphaerota bacterium]
MHRTRIKEARKPDLLTAVTKEGIEVQSKEEVEEELLRGIGSRWETPKERELSEEMKGKWKKYTERIGGLEGIGGEPEDEEIDLAVEWGANRKGMATDRISKEMIVNAPEEIRVELRKKVKELYNGNMKEEDGETLIKLLTKDENERENKVDNLRPISLIRYTSKILLTVIANRWKAKDIGMTNYAFTRGVGTMEAAFKIEAIMEHAKLHGKKIHMLMIDIEKAYDKIRFDVLDEAMERYGMPRDIRRVIWKMHVRRTVSIEHGYGRTKPTKVQCGLAQGSPVSCVLFIMVMQILLDRLANETEGICSKKDDTGFADDLTAMAYDCIQLAKKWAIVLEFARYVGLDISMKKTKYMTNEEDESKKFRWEGVDEVQGEAVKILGYWMERTLKKEEQMKKMMMGLEVVERRMYRKSLPPNVVKGVVNEIMNARVRYVAAVEGIPKIMKTKIETMVKRICKRKIGMKNEAINEYVFASKKVGGMGIRNPVVMAEAALVNEYVYHMNYETSQGLKEIMNENYEIMCGRTGGEILALGEKKSVAGMNMAGVDQMKWVKAVQVREILKGRGWRMVKEEDRAEMKEFVKRSKTSIARGRMMIIKQGEGDEFVARVEESMKGDEKAKIKVMWYPRVESGGVSVFGGKSRIKKKGDFVLTSEEMIRITETYKLQHQVVAQLKNQWDFDEEYKMEKGKKIGNVSKIPGIGIVSEMEVNADMKWYQASKNEEIVDVMIRGKIRKIRALRITKGKEIERTGWRDRYEMEKEELLKRMADPNEKLEIYTDGSVKKEGRSVNAGCGIAVRRKGNERWMALAYAVEGVYSSSGAEAKAITKVLKWRGKMVEGAKINIYTDSKVSMDWIVMEERGSGRKMHRNREANVIEEMRRETKKKENIENVQVWKVTSHTGVEGNEVADVAAAKGRTKVGVPVAIVRQERKYTVVDEKG